MIVRATHSCSWGLIPSETKAKKNNGIMKVLLRTYKNGGNDPDTAGKN